MNQEDIEFFRSTFNVDLANKSNEEIEILLNKIEEDLNMKLLKAQKENLELEKELLDLMNRTDHE